MPGSRWGTWKKIFFSLFSILCLFAVLGFMMIQNQCINQSVKTYFYIRLVLFVLTLFISFTFISYSLKILSTDVFSWHYVIFFVINYKYTCLADWVEGYIFIYSADHLKNVLSLTGPLALLLVIWPTSAPKNKMTHQVKPNDWHLCCESLHAGFIGSMSRIE